MLKSTCNRCGKLIPYAKPCPCTAQDKRDRDRRYDTLYRDREASAIYHSKAWTKARAVAIARDHGLCLMCLMEKRITLCDMVHHIVEISEDASRAYDVDNLISLCNGCHQRVHKAYESDKAETQEKLIKLIEMAG